MCDVVSACVCALSRRRSSASRRGARRRLLLMLQHLSTSTLHCGIYMQMHHACIERTTLSLCVYMYMLCIIYCIHALGISTPTRALYSCTVRAYVCMYIICGTGWSDRRERRRRDPGGAAASRLRRAPRSRGVNEGERERGRSAFVLGVCVCRCVVSDAPTLATRCKCVYIVVFVSRCLLCLSSGDCRYDGGVVEFARIEESWREV